MKTTDTQNSKPSTQLVTPWGWAWRAVYPLPEHVAAEARAKRGKAVPEQVLQFNRVEGGYTMLPFSAIDQKRARFIEVYPFYDKTKQPVRIVMSKRLRLTFMRREVDVGYLGFKTLQFFVIGYTYKVKGESVNSYLYLLPDGTTYMSAVDNINVPELILYA